MIVTWAPAGDSWCETLDEAEFLPILEDGIRLENTKLLVWTGGEEDLTSTEGLKDVAWMFALPLFSVTSRSKIHDFVLSPFVKLLTGDWRAALNNAPALPLAANELGRVAPVIVSQDPDAI